MLGLAHSACGADAVAPGPHLATLADGAADPDAPAVPNSSGDPNADSTADVAAATGDAGADLQPPGPPDAAAGDTPDADTGPPAGLCGTKKHKTWSRKSQSIGGAVVFSEVMYNSQGNPDLGWVELHNPLGIDFDLSGFRLDGAVHYTFATGTMLKARGYLVVAANAAALGQSPLGTSAAVGSFAGALPLDAGTIELWNNFGRLMDTVTYADGEPWPVLAGGSGASLAKRDPAGLSTLAENWVASDKLGGTPGAANFPAPTAAPPPATLVAPGATWHYLASGAAPPADWTGGAFDDTQWTAGPANFYAADAGPASVPLTAKFTADNFLALYIGKADGSGLQYVGRDAIGDWTSPESFGLAVKPDDFLYVAAWEAPGDSGGPQALIGEVPLPGGAMLSTSANNFEWILGPVDSSPGGALSDPAPTAAAITSLVQAGNASKSWAAPQAATDKNSAPWGGVVGSAFAPGTQYVWADTFGDLSVSNTANSFVLFRSKGPLLASQGATQLPAAATTSYFRTKFVVTQLAQVVQPWLEALIDDGAVIYLNGQEVLRLRMPDGPIGPATLASFAVQGAPVPVSLAVPATALLSGENVLAVEVHQAQVGDTDLVMGAALSASLGTPTVDAPEDGLRLTEVAATGSSGFWVELTNLGAAPTETSGFIVKSSYGPAHVLPPHVLAPGAQLLLDQAALGFGAPSGTKIFLYAPGLARVLDGVAVQGVPRARLNGSLPQWRYPDQPTPGAPNAFVLHDEVVIHEIMYRGPPVPGADGLPSKSALEWIELYNRSQKTVDISGYQLVDALEYTVPPATLLGPGGYFVVASDVAAMQAAYPKLAGAGPDLLGGPFGGSLSDSGEQLVLRDACGNPVDSVRYSSGGSWPELAHGGGSSLELRDARADNSAGDAWAPSNEGKYAAWQNITYEAVAAPSAVGPDGAYQEFVVGLLDSGVALIDDLSVIEDPAGAAKQLLQNGTFEGGAGAWRLLGNHRHSSVVVDPTDPSNHVLRVVATGAAEHMHNHLETTLSAGHAISNGKTYRISLRARWQGGSNQLNTRLYFNRLAKTHALPTPPLHGTPGAANSTAVPNIGPTYSDLRHAPAVPAAQQPVLVSVRAADPDGVSALTLWYSVDSGPAQSLAMNPAADGRWLALVPGQAAGAVVQFYVWGKDGSGVGAAFPADGAASRAAYKVNDGLAAKGGLHNLRLIMTPADIKWTFDPKNLMSNDRIGATVIDDESRVYYDVGLRLKGSERGRPESVRVGFALRFSPDQPFRGIHQDLMVDRSEGVGFGQRELFFNQAMNRAGTVASQYDDLVQVLTPKTQHTGPAQLQLARFGELLLDAQFDKGSDGPVYEYELIYYPTTTDDGTPQGYKLPLPDNVIGTAISDLGPDKEAYRLNFILKSNRWRDDYSGLMAFAKVMGSQGQAFDAAIDGVADVDEFLRSFAFATLSGAVDNYGAGDAHNGNFYVRPSDNRVLYLPHDLDFYGGSPNSAVVASSDLAKLVATPQRKRAYYGHLYDIISTAYNATYMAWWSDYLGKLLPGQNFAGHLKFVAARADWVLNAAPNAILKAIPKVAFSLATGATPLSIEAPQVTLQGQGWIDVHQLLVGKPPTPLPLTWTDLSTWQTTVPLVCGPQKLDLVAQDAHGTAVGAASVVVTRTGVGCP